MSVKFNPFSGTFDFVEGAASAPAGYNVELITISAGQEAAKEVTLSASPTNVNRTLLLIKGAPNQFFGEDYTVSGNTLSWNGLGLDGILAAGDKLAIVYN